ncbi:DUF1707 SHOCT-like domain-containing protein [Aestuariimicrobium ganziense]|uniref:DUF1707 SHOCT-like domain-containing protein n=1 Tax=Aestuariimicrobium ganziense TaxID=2773677 RepID=UPI001944A47E|nr:DUF1707 domain-containing protein [Aestuariimicrobium ganziense]
MSNLPISSKYRSQPDLPVDDEEREGLVDRLNKAFGDGLIDQDTYRAHLDRVFEARTLGDLLPVAQVLPARPTHQLPAIVAQADSGPPPGELTPAVNAQRAGLATLGVAGVGLVLALVLLLVILL